jgi:hypothetical protein
MATGGGGDEANAAVDEQQDETSDEIMESHKNEDGDK